MLAPHMPNAHPDADLLNAFAEQVVLPAEREQVLEHLAVCEDCRSVLLVALPPMESAAPAVAAEAASQSAVPRASRPGWFSRPLFTWPNLSWAALAAGMIVAGAFFMHQPVKQAQPVAERQSPTAISQPASTTQPPESAANTVAGQQKTIDAQPGRQLELARNAGLQTSITDRKEAALKAESKKAGGQNEKDTVIAAASRAPQAPAAVSRLDAAAANEPVIADKTSTDSLIVSKEESVPVHRAKPPTAEEQGMAQSRAKAAPALMAKTAGIQMAQVPIAPRWSLSAGILRRSLGSGTTWQAASPDAHLLSYAVHESDVWAGGKSGLLFHSADGGTTWTQIHPAVGDRSLSNDVTSMQMNAASEVVLSTSNGEIWTSLDNGKTWSSK